MLDLEYVQLNVTKVLALFNKVSHSSCRAGARLTNSYLQRGDSHDLWARSEAERGGLKLRYPVLR